MCTPVNFKILSNCVSSCLFPFVLFALGLYKSIDNRIRFSKHFLHLLSLLVLILRSSVVCLNWLYVLKLVMQISYFLEGLGE